MKLENQKFYKEVVELLNNARNKVKRTVDSIMTYTYYEVGWRIVEEKQKGEKHAEYGKQLVENISKILTKEFGKGYTFTELTRMKQLFDLVSL